MFEIHFLTTKKTKLNLFESSLNSEKRSMKENTQYHELNISEKENPEIMFWGHDKANYSPNIMWLARGEVVAVTNFAHAMLFYHTMLSCTNIML